MDIRSIKKSFVYKGFLVWGRHSTPGFPRHVRVSRSSDAITSLLVAGIGIRTYLGSVLVCSSDKKGSHARQLRSVKIFSDRIGELLSGKLIVHVRFDQQSVGSSGMQIRVVEGFCRPLLRFENDSD